MQRMVHSVISIIEITQGTDLPSVPQTTKFTLTQPFRTANNTIQQTQMRLRRRHQHGNIPLKVGQNICIEQLLSTREQSNYFPARCTTLKTPGCIQHNFTQMSLIRQLIESKVTPRICRLFTS